MTDASRRAAPDLSLVLPCYDEEEVVESTVSDLFRAFAAIGKTLEIVAVDNGSRDRTGAILARLARERDRLVVVTVETNQGYGHGLLSGLPLAKAPWVGILCADGQVAAEDVAQLFLAAERSPSPALHKVRRRFRRDGLKRKIVSVVYNLAMAVLFPGLASIDVNGNPKLLPRSRLEEMHLAARDWFLDAEILLEARRLRLPVVEIDVVGHARGGGASNVRASTCLEFVRNIARRRLGRSSPARGGDPAKRENPGERPARGR